MIGHRSRPPLRVGVNARLLSSPSLRGFNRYAAELVRALAAGGIVEPVLFSDAPIHEVHALGELPSFVQPLKPQMLWQHRWLPLALRRERIDVFHAPAHWGIPWRAPCPTVATIHDLADLELPALAASGTLRAAARHAFEQNLVASRADRIVAVSEWTAGSITRWLGVDRNRIAVTVEGAAPVFDVAPEAGVVEATRRRLSLAGPYYIYVGGFDARKNLGALVGALAATAPERRVPVALVGEGGGAAEALRRRAVEAGVAHWLRLLGGVDDSTLAALYAGALAVVLPSWLEGFGLPVVEAMHVGTPSIVSSAGSLPEIAGDAGLTFPPADPGALAAAMRRVSGDPGVRAELASRARDRASLYTWSRAAEQTLAVYEQAVTARPRA
jgi:glycosyltransferase involved in cell wall biosynthesis